MIEFEHEPVSLRNLKLFPCANHRSELPGQTREVFANVMHGSYGSPAKTHEKLAY